MVGACACVVWRGAQVRLGEREALDGMLQWFEARKGQLKRLAYYQERRLRRLGLIDDGACAGCWRRGKPAPLLCA